LRLPPVPGPVQSSSGSYSTNIELDIGAVKQVRLNIKLNLPEDIHIRQVWLKKASNAEPIVLCKYIKKFQKDNNATLSFQQFVRPTPMVH
jgi:hypothetical protein